MGLALSELEDELRLGLMLSEFFSKICLFGPHGWGSVWVSSDLPPVLVQPSHQAVSWFKWLEKTPKRHVKITWNSHFSAHKKCGVGTEPPAFACLLSGAAFVPRGWVMWS